MASHREKQYYYVLLGVGVFLFVASLWILFDYQNAFTTVISFILSSIVGFLVGALLSAALGYTMGIRYNPRIKIVTIDYKFTKKWFRSTFKVSTVAFGILLTLMISSSSLMDEMTNDFYYSLVNSGFVQNSIILAALGLLTSSFLIYFAFGQLDPSVKL